MRKTIFRMTDFNADDTAGLYTMKKPMASQRHVVLVVEDNPLQRMMAVALLEAAGFHAIEAANALDAVLVLERRTDVKALLTDVDMPGGMNGLMLAALVQSRWPQIGIVIVSGHTRPAVERLPAGSSFFTKPYRSDDILDALGVMCQTGDASVEAA